jgi:hypothetical protein
VNAQPKMIDINFPQQSTIESNSNAFLPSVKFVLFVLIVCKLVLVTLSEMNTLCALLLLPLVAAQFGVSDKESKCPSNDATIYHANISFQ